MEAGLVAWWWLFLSNICLALGSVFEGKELEKSLLEKLENGAVVERVLHGWSDRPKDLFQGIDKQTWQEIIPRLSDSQLSEIHPKEFELSETACEAFAEHLPKLSDTRALPDTFRRAVCKLLKEENERNRKGRHALGFNSYKIVQVIGAIPAGWMKTHGELFMKALTESKPQGLGQLQKETLAALLNNPNHACQSLTLDVLLGLSPMQLALISPSCAGEIIGLGAMDLSEVVGYLRNDVFSEYDGPLSRETIQNLSGEQIEKFGYSFINDDRQICTLLELSYLSPTAVARVTSPCLCGYFGSGQEVIGLGELWKSIGTYQVYPTMLLTKSCLANIPLREFDWMGLEALHGILSLSRFCPTTDIAFWSVEKVEHISPECLYRILDKAIPPVKLGKLWQATSHLNLEISFTPEMQSSWLKIARDDFDLMPGKVLTAISSGPGVCTALETSFWMGEKMESISGECLYEIISKEVMAPKLGSLWKSIPTQALHDFIKELRSFWTVIHPEDFQLAQLAVGLAIKDNANICANLDISFWTGETMRYVSEDCLLQIIQSLEKPIALGKLWEHMPLATVKVLMGGWLSNHLEYFAGSDYQHMPSSLLNWIFSPDRTRSYLPNPPKGVILSSRASNIVTSPIRFAEIVRLEPSVAGQLLWYSKKLPGNVLSSCSGSDIRSLSLVIPGELELDWKSLFAELEERYISDNRAGSFSLMINSISDQADTHFCATIETVEEFHSLPWLGRNLGFDCWSKLPPKAQCVSRPTKIPESPPAVPRQAQ